MTTVLSYPTLSTGPSGFDWRLLSSSSNFSSPLSGRDQSQFFGGGKWQAKVDYAVLSEADTRLLSAFIAQMRGRSGRCYLGPLHAPSPLGSAGGSPIVNGANQLGVSLVTTGWPLNVNGVLLPGDFFQVETSRGQQVLMVTQPVNTDGAGNATISFKPNLRSAAQTGTPIQTNGAQCVMMLAQDENPMDFTPPIIGAINLTFIEPIP